MGGLPGEIFTELGMAIKRVSSYPITIVTELAKGTISYVPTRMAFAQGAYEVRDVACYWPIRRSSC